MPIRRDPQGHTTVLEMVAGAQALSVATWLEAEGLPSARFEYRAFPPRRWRFDLAWPDYKIALEIDGGVYTRGRHTRGVGFERDCWKMNEAAASGWCVFRATPTMLQTEWREIVRILRAAFEMRRG